MRIVFFTPGISASRTRLQPWLTFHEVGVRLRDRGHDVWLATDGGAGDQTPLPTKCFRTLRGTGSASVRAWLKEVRPDAVAVSVTPMGLVTAGWHAALDRRNTLAVLSYSLYDRRELAGAWRHLSGSDRWGYGRNLLIPGVCWRLRLSRLFKGVVCQSQRAAGRVGGRIDCRVIPPGIDLEHWRPAGGPGDRMGPFLYMGSILSIRGFEVLIEALCRLPEDCRLRILARGSGEEEQSSLKARLDALGLMGRVEIKGGWMTPEELRQEIQGAAAVVLPFVLVPSEVPVSVMEAVACGTPVIVTDIDGLPEAAGGAGLVVPPGDAAALAKAMKRTWEEEGLLPSLRKACLARREEFEPWTAVTDRWAEALGI